MAAPGRRGAARLAVAFLNTQRVSFIRFLRCPSPPEPRLPRARKCASASASHAENSPRPRPRPLHRDEVCCGPRPLHRPARRGLPPPLDEIRHIACSMEEDRRRILYCVDRPIPDPHAWPAHPQPRRIRSPTPLLRALVSSSYKLLRALVSSSYITPEVRASSSVTQAAARYISLFRFSLDLRIVRRRQVGGIVRAWSRRWRPT
jgi:hypothetical protein